MKNKEWMKKVRQEKPQESLTYELKIFQWLQGKDWLTPTNQRRESLFNSWGPQ